MPLNRKIVWPWLVAGAGGTTHRVENRVMGLPVLFVQKAYEIQPEARAGTTAAAAAGAMPGAGTFGAWNTLPGIRGSRVGRLRSVPKLLNSLPFASIFFNTSAAIARKAPGSIWWTNDFCLYPPGVRTKSSAAGTLEISTPA